MRTRFVTPIAWALGLGLCFGPRAKASADVSPSSLDAEARIARAQASANVWTMESASRRARAILQHARRKGDANEVGCADEGLSRVDTALRWGRDHAALLNDAWNRGDAKVARGELARVAAAAASARAASAQTELCVDEPRPSEGTTVRLIIEDR
jgi:hypothetical protein